MRDVRFRISNYLVELYGGTPDASDTEGYRAQILLFDWAGNKRRAVVRFYERQSLPADSRDEGGLLVLHMPAAMLPTVIDLLRHENPVYVEWRKAEPRPRLTTYLEPVGEH